MIVFIDSGVGGINVLCECAKLFNEDFVYLCDNKNAPYGNKSKTKLLKITKQNIDYLLSKYDINGIVLACNTLSFTIYEQVKSMYNIPVYRMFFDCKKLGTLKKDVLFFGTKNTIKNNNIIRYKISSKKGYKSLYIKNLALDIDNNLNNLDCLNEKLYKYLKKNKYKNVKTVVLCCTHFKLIKKQIQSCYSSKLLFYEYEQDVAKYLSTVVENKESRSFKIELTDYTPQTYIKLKCYLLKCLRKVWQRLCLILISLYEMFFVSKKVWHW